MADGNGATANKQIISWIVTGLSALVMVLFQFAILGRLETLDSHTQSLDERTGRIETDVGSLKTGRADDDRIIESLTTEVQQVREAFEQSQQQKINKLELDSKTRQFAAKHAREHEEHETKALTDELVKKAVMDEDP